MRVLFFDSNEFLMNLLPNGFSAAGHEIMVVPATSQESVAKAVSEFQPGLVITFGWGMEQVPLKQIWIRTYTRLHGIKHVYWSVEDPAFTESFVKPVVLTYGQPDYVFTICQDAVQTYQSLGYPSAHLDWACQPQVHRPVPQKPEYTVDIAVIANAYYWVLGQSQYDLDYRVVSMHNLIKPVLDAGLRIDFWGRGWEAMQPCLGRDIPAEWLHGPLPYLECNKVYSSAKLIIGLQNFQTQVTQRTYEILGSGGLLLTSDTPAIRQQFTPGEHLLVSSSPEQTLQILHEIKNRPQLAQTIRDQGRVAVLREHTYRRRAEFILQVLQQSGVIS